MSKDFPIIKFTERNQDNARTPGGGSKEKPGFTLTGEDLVSHGNLLLDQLRTVHRKWDDSLVTEAPSVIEVTYVDEAKAKSHQSKIIETFKNFKHTTQIGSTVNNGIIIQLNTIHQLNEVINKMESFNEYDVVISAISEIKKYEPRIIDSQDTEYNLTFWDFLDQDKNEQVFREVEKNLEQENIEYKRDSFGNGESVVEVSNITLDKLEFIKKLPIKKIEPTEKTESSFHDVDFRDVELKKVAYDSTKSYPVVGLLDDGVEINEYTREWVTRGKGCAYFEKELKKDHGTYISTLLIHGDYFNNTSDFSVDGCKIVEVPIVPNYSLDSKILIRNIENAITENKDIQIWNLSVSLDKEINDNEFSTFAKELDRIQEENDVLIFKSAGNDVAFFSGGKAGKLYTGADSVRSITIGSVNSSTDNFSVLQEGYPAPYSRIGRGPAFIIKPELVHFGGDLFSKNQSPQSRDDYIQVGGIGITKNQKMIQQPGTSFSTPKVAKIAAEIKEYLQTDDLLMIKALLIHSATHSPNLNLPEDEITQKMGFGRPGTSSSIVLEDSNHSVTLMLKGRLEKGKEIDIMDFPYPSSLIEQNMYKGRIVVTLVSNPYLRNDLASEYCQTNLDLKFGTYDKKEDVEGRRAIFNSIKRDGSKNVLLRSIYSKRAINKNSNYNYERTLIEYGSKYYPVKKYACDLSEFLESNKKYLDSSRKWYIYLKGEYRDYITKEIDREHAAFIDGTLAYDYEEPGIEYCMLVSIYDSEKEKNVYDSVINELNNLGFSHERVSINNSLSVETDTSSDF